MSIGCYVGHNQVNKYSCISRFAVSRRCGESADVDVDVVVVDVVVAHAELIDQVFYVASYLHLLYRGHQPVMRT